MRHKVQSRQIRLALVAPSGSGKSTTAALLKKRFKQAGKRVDIIKLASPLYALQRAFYDQACRLLPEDAQDQRLLERIATELRHLDAECLVKNFMQRLEQSSADVVINDDLRDDLIDWPHLRRSHFNVVKIVTDSVVRAERLGRRGDLSVVEKSPLDLQMQRIRADYALPNNGALEALSGRIDSLVDWLLDVGAREAA